MDEITELRELETKDIKSFSFDGIETFAKIVKVYDGDTLTIVFKYKDEFIKYRCRLTHINAPELKEIGGKESKDYLSSLVLDKILKVKFHSFDKYGRILIQVFLETGENVGELIETNHYANKYD
jgi:endonuclease YncB( thermonuclease family)